jgi:hypothetical protein
MSDGILQEDWERYDAAMAADGNMNGSSERNPRRLSGLANAF